MDEKKQIHEVSQEKNEEKSYIVLLKEAQKRLPNIVLPSMGILNNEQTVPIMGADFIRKKGE